MPTGTAPAGCSAWMSLHVAHLNTTDECGCLLVHQLPDHGTAIPHARRPLLDPNPCAPPPPPPPAPPLTCGSELASVPNFSLWVNTHVVSEWLTMYSMACSPSESYSGTQYRFCRLHACGGAGSKVARGDAGVSRRCKKDPSRGSAVQRGGAQLHGKLAHPSQKNTVHLIPPGWHRSRTCARHGHHRQPTCMAIIHSGLLAPYTPTRP